MAEPPDPPSGGAGKARARTSHGPFREVGHAATRFLGILPLLIFQHLLAFLALLLYNIGGFVEVSMTLPSPKLSMPWGHPR